MNVRSIRAWCLLAMTTGLLCPLGERLAAAGPCPNLTILLDASGSMLENPAGPGGAIEPTVSKRKSTIAITALTNLVNTYDGVLPLGLSIFPSDGLCGAAQLNVAPALFTGQSINSLLSKSAPTSFAPDTPTSASITSIGSMTPLKDPGRGQYVLLVTDGKPECGNGSENVTKTVNALKAAVAATPSIKTFVVGFGMLDATSQGVMNQLADAGGVPTGDPTYHYYQAGDAASLSAALDKILVSIAGELGSTMCDDSCYANGCVNPSDKCIGRMCQKDPCAGVSCDAGQYCYTDGVSAGVCVAVCATPCGAGTYCDRGQCVAGPCGLPCGPGKTCNAGTRTCEADPACATLTPKCTAPRGCIAGKCVDDPCASSLITCPEGSQCKPWVGTCESNSAGQPIDPEGGGGLSSAGCSCNMRAGQTGSQAGALAAAVLFTALFRRRQRSRRDALNS